MRQIENMRKKREKPKQTGCSLARSMHATDYQNMINSVLNSV